MPAPAPAPCSPASRASDQGFRLISAPKYLRLLDGTDTEFMLAETLVTDPGFRVSPVRSYSLHYSRFRTMGFAMCVVFPPTKVNCFERKPSFDT